MTDGAPDYNERLVETLFAGSSPLYDILINDAGSVIIRDSQDHSKQIRLLDSFVPEVAASIVRAVNSRSQ